MIGRSGGFSRPHKAVAFQVESDKKIQEVRKLKKDARKKQV